MNAERWREIGEVFGAALEYPLRHERRRFLDCVCAGDAELRREVDRLLAADEDSPSFLEEPVCRIEEAPRRSPDAKDAEGRRLGPYRLLRTLAEGGMGTVYLAERDDREYRRRVAVKLVRRDLARPDVLRRFRNERQILAALEHPNVARLYDGGTTADGQPYLVMEYVDGRPVTDYCDRHRLSVEERLELFLKVCDAVRYAHRNLLVHRDLKPSNVLVTRDGVPKLLDFGIAKLLGRDGSSRAVRAETTAVGQRPMTPGYASPEQVRGDAVTTLSDVYSLGVLLYELLTGRSPYRTERGLVHEIERAICEQDLEKPSRAVDRCGAGRDGLTARTVSRARGARPAELRRRLAGDLDLIVLKALAKEPERRFKSVGRLAEDVERHLRQLPVCARPASLAYRAGKFLRRHRLGVAAASLLAVFLGIFLVTLARQSELIDRERRHAREVTRGLTDVLVAEPRQAAVHRLAAGEVLEVAVPRLRAELGDRAAEAALLDALGLVYHQAGLSHAARDLMETSLELRRETPGATPRGLATGLHNLGAVEASLGAAERGEALLSEALDQRRRLVGDEHAAVAETKEALALARWHQEDYASAETLLTDALATRENACPAARNYWAADVMSHLSALYARTGRLAEAEKTAMAARRRRRTFGDHRPDRAKSLDDQARLHFARGEIAAAEALYREALELRRALMMERASQGRAMPGETHQAVAESLHNVARCLGERGAYEEAQRYFSESLAMIRRLKEGDSPEVATLLNNLAVVLGNKGEHAAAEALFRRVLEMRLELLGEEHPHVAQARYSLGRLLHDRGDLTAAEGLYREAAATLARALPPGHPASSYPQVAMARLWLDRGAAAAAEDALREALAHLGVTHAAGHWRIADAESLLGASLAAQGRHEEAAELLWRGYVVLQTQRGARDPRTRQALARLADLYRSQPQEPPPEAFTKPELTSL